MSKVKTPLAKAIFLRNAVWFINAREKVLNNSKSKIFSNRKSIENSNIWTRTWTGTAPKPAPDPKVFDTTNTTKWKTKCNISSLISCEKKLN